MRLHDLQPAPGATRDTKRLGRGNASGQGTTAGKGTKGQKARAGGGKAGFRGMSSRNQRTAKRRGFTNIFRTPVESLNLYRLAQLPNGTTVDPEFLELQGLVTGKQTRVKILGEGDITVALHLVNVDVSGGARQKVEAAGGTIRGVEPAAVAEEGETDASGSA